MTVLEVPEPAPHDRVDPRDDLRQALPCLAPRLGSNGRAELLLAPLARPPLPSLEVVPQKVKPSPLLRIYDSRLLRVQAQPVGLHPLPKDLQRRFGLTYLFISHNIGVIRHISDRIAVMYLGKVVEMADKRALFAQPAHPYTQALLAAVPSLDPRQKREEVILEGDVPSPVNPPPGCRFHTRCRHAMPRCSKEEPVFQRLADGRRVACHLYGSGFQGSRGQLKNGKSYNSSP